jgi:cell division protease FtsH
MAATNRPEILDPALIRPGRFDRHILVDRPSLKGREAILRIHSRQVKLADVNFETLASRTPGMVGSDLANIVNEAALLAARKNKAAVVSMRRFRGGHRPGHRRAGEAQPHDESQGKGDRGLP